MTMYFIDSLCIRQMKSNGCFVLSAKNWAVLHYDTICIKKTHTLMAVCVFLMQRNSLR